VCRGCRLPQGIDQAARIFFAVCGDERVDFIGEADDLRRHVVDEHGAVHPGSVEVLEKRRGAAGELGDLLEVGALLLHQLQRRGLEQLKGLNVDVTVGDQGSSQFSVLSSRRLSKRRVRVFGRQEIAVSCRGTVRSRQIQFNEVIPGTRGADQSHAGVVRDRRRGFGKIQRQFRGIAQSLDRGDRSHTHPRDLYRCSGAQALNIVEARAQPKRLAAVARREHDQQSRKERRLSQSFAAS
jgi:hypothetical protein